MSEKSHIERAVSDIQETGSVVPVMLLFTGLLIYAAYVADEETKKAKRLPYGFLGLFVSLTIGCLVAVSGFFVIPESFFDGTLSGLTTCGSCLLLAFIAYNLLLCAFIRWSEHIRIRRLIHEAKAPHR